MFTPSTATATPATMTAGPRRLAVALALAVLPFATACGDDAGSAPPTAVAEAEESIGGVDDRGLGGVAQEAFADRVGETVTLPGEVAQIVGPSGFTIGGDELGETPLLVTTSVNPEVDEGDTVTVQGEVIEFSVAGVEEDLGVDLIDNDFEDFQGDPAVKASQVTKV